jgi:hypothetical protein
MIGSIFGGVELNGLRDCVWARSTVEPAAKHQVAGRGCGVIRAEKAPLFGETIPVRQSVAKGSTAQTNEKKLLTAAEIAVSLKHTVLVQKGIFWFD